jgi:hypothetical protein
MDCWYTHNSRFSGRLSARCPDMWWTASLNASGAENGRPEPDSELKRCPFHAHRIIGLHLGSSARAHHHQAVPSAAVVEAPSSHHTEPDRGDGPRVHPNRTAVVATLAPPEALGVATIATRAACASARPPVISQAVEPARSQGTKGTKPSGSRDSHTHGSHHTTSDTRSVRPGLALMLPPLG